MLKKRWFWVVLVLVMVLGAVGLGLNLRSRGPTTIEVQTEPVDRKTIVQTVTATGRIQPKTQVKISADVSAKITRLEVAEGAWVDKGTLLLELDREQYLAAVESAQASMRVAQANADVSRENRIKSEKDHARVRELYDKRLETEERLDGTSAELKAQSARERSALDQVEQARATLKQRQDELSKTRIYAPISGTVSQLNKEAGEIALGSQFQEDVIMVIATLSGMEALVDVDENDIVSVAVGDRATIEVDALPDLVLHGRVTEIANTAKVSSAGTTDQKTEFQVKVAIDEVHPELRPGMTASSEIVTDTRENVLGVPIQAVAVRTPEQLESHGGKDDTWKPDKEGFIELIWIVEGDAAQARQVRAGIQSDKQIEILEGLEEGQEIVVGNYRAISKDLTPGAAISVADAGVDGPP